MDEMVDDGTATLSSEKNSPQLVNALLMVRSVGSNSLAPHKAFGPEGLHKHSTRDSSRLGRVDTASISKPSRSYAAAGGQQCQPKLEKEFPE
jgi:hypothetical protein